MTKTFKKLSFATAAILTIGASSLAMAHPTATVNGSVVMEEPDSTNITAKSKSTTVVTAPAQMSILTYDLNNDGMLSASEIGNKLFYQFDRDGNESLDNIEWNKPVMVNLAPMETISVTKMDIDGDGIDDDEVVKVDIFMEATGLSRFDNDGNGLSPREFTGKSVLEMDTDKSGLIEMKEWKKAYTMRVSPKAANNDIYNDGQ